eukprot:5542491-Alexandrium_andersonii.AAC.1
MVATRTASSSTYVGTGAKVVERTAVATGSNARRQRKGLMGPPMPTPARTGRRTASPPGRQ